MKKHRILLPVILVLLGAFLAMGPAAAQSTKTDFTATATQPTTLDHGELRLDGAGNLHIKGEVQLLELDSNDPQVDGTLTIEIDLILRQDDNGFYCSGPAHGSLSIDPEAVDGTWEVTWSGMFTDCGLTGHANGHGTGNLEGQTIKFTFQEVNPPGVEEVDLIGNIHNPHGN
jgi:hypothetical protein